MRDNNAEELVSQQSPGGNLKSLFFILLKMFLFYYFIFPIFWALSQNGEKRLLAPSCPSVRPHGTALHPLDGFS
jgi:hypothetical protein